MAEDRIGQCDDCHADDVPVWDYGALNEGAWQYCGFCMAKRGWGDIVR